MYFTSATINNYASNLVSAWNMETLGQDVVGANNLTVASVSHIAGINNQAAIFNGTTSMLSITHAAQSGLGFTNAMTLSAWVKPSVLVGTNPIVTKYKSANDARCYAAWLVGGKPQVFISADGTNATSTSLAADTTISVGEWHHVAMRYDGAVLALFVDGVKIKTADHITGIANKGAAFIVGADESSNRSPDTIDEVYVWSAALSDAAIIELYNSGTGRFLVEADATPPVAGTAYAAAGSGENETATLYFNLTTGHDDIDGSGYAATTYEFESGGLVYEILPGYGLQTQGTATDHTTLYTHAEDAQDKRLALGFPAPLAVADTYAAATRLRGRTWDNSGNSTASAWCDIERLGEVEQPTAPTITAVLAGNGAATVTADLNAANNPAYIVYRRLGNNSSFSAIDESLKIIASGSSVIITDLENNAAYEIAAVSKTTGLFSDLSNVFQVVPMVDGGSLTSRVAAVVAAEINGAALYDGMTATAENLPILEPENIGKKLHCNVLPESHKEEILTASEVQKTVIIQVVLQKRVKDESEVSELVNVAESILNTFEMRSFPFENGQILCAEFELEPVYDRAELKDNNIFASVLKLTFLVA